MEASDASGIRGPFHKYIVLVDGFTREESGWLEALDDLIKKAHSVGSGSETRVPVPEEAPLRRGRVFRLSESRPSEWSEWALSSTEAPSVAMFVDLGPIHPDNHASLTKYILSLGDTAKFVSSVSNVHVLVADEDGQFQMTDHFPGATILTVNRAQAIEMVTTLGSSLEQHEIDPTRLDPLRMLIDHFSTTADPDGFWGHAVDCGGGAVDAFNELSDEVLARLEDTCQSVSDAEWRKITSDKLGQNDLCDAVQEYKRLRAAGHDASGALLGKLGILELCTALTDAASLASQSAGRTDPGNHAMRVNPNNNSVQAHGGCGPVNVNNGDGGDAMDELTERIQEL